MPDLRTTYMDWFSGRPRFDSAGPQVAYQYDHLSNIVIFENAPKLDNYYLIVSMKETADGPVKTLAPIQLAGSFWLIPNTYTQLPQTISFQVCCRTPSGNFEKHSAQFLGEILPSKDHDGEALDVDPSVMFEPYVDWVTKQAYAAGAMVIDSALIANSTNPVQNKVVTGAINGVQQALDDYKLTAAEAQALANMFGGDDT